MFYATVAHSDYSHITVTGSPIKALCTIRKHTTKKQGHKHLSIMKNSQTVLVSQICYLLVKLLSPTKRSNRKVQILLRRRHFQKIFARTDS